jgi:hypothetical protein
MKLLKIVILCFSLLFSAFSLSAQSIWGGSVVNFVQGTTNLTNTIAEERSNPEMALSSSSGDDHINFVSLGFAGEITIKMSQPIRNGEGNDLKIWETTYNSPSCNVYPERAWVFASQDGCNFVSLGLICQDSELDLGDLNWALYIKILDASPFEGFRRQGEVDAYDVDAIEGFYLETEMVPTSLQSGFATSVIEYTQGTRKNGTPITVARTNPQMALGVPQGTDVINFVSLGFGGQLIVGLDFVKFNQPGWDLQFIETSFGNPTCQNYPEKAFIEVSKDLINWSFAEIVCLDSYVDVQSTDWFQYIRITDRSAASQFSGSADGYDVDGILTIQDCQTQLSRRVDYDDVLTPDEDIEDILFPNPFDHTINLNISEEVQISIMDYSGRRLQTLKATGKFEVDLKPGYYYFEVRQKNGTTSMHKLVKR